MYPFLMTFFKTKNVSMTKHLGGCRLSSLMLNVLEHFQRENENGGPMVLVSSSMHVKTSNSLLNFFYEIINLLHF